MGKIMVKVMVSNGKQWKIMGKVMVSNGKSYGK